MVGICSSMVCCDDLCGNGGVSRKQVQPPVNMKSQGKHGATYLTIESIRGPHPRRDYLMAGMLYAPMSVVVWY